MLKKLLALIGACILLFCSPVFANEIKTDPTETIKIMEDQGILNTIGIKSVNLDPGYDNVYQANATWNISNGSYNKSNPLYNNVQAFGYAISIICESSDITKTNVVKFNLPTTYFSSYDNFVIYSGSCDDFSLDGNVLTIYNPKDLNSGNNTSDLQGVVYASQPYANHSGQSIYSQFNGSILELSSGTELVDLLKEQLNVVMAVQVLASLVGVCIGFVFMWWGVRKMGSAIMAAFRKGRLRI